MRIEAGSVRDRLRAAGLDESAVAEWIAAEPQATKDYDGDRRRFSEFWGRSDDLVRRLPQKPARNEVETAAAQAIFYVSRENRERFLGAHVEEVYDTLTRARSRFVRLEDLVAEAAASVPGLTPSPDQIAIESDRQLRDKDGVEIDKGIFLAHVLASERAGRHVCHAMLLPRADTAELLAKLAVDGAVDLDKASVERRDKAIFVTMKNPRFLNAEDQTTICTAAASRSCGFSSATLASSINSCAAWRDPMRCRTMCMVMASKNPGSR